MIVTHMPKIAPARTLAPSDAGYPALLRDVPHPPATLHIMGDFDFEKIPLVAIVGTRKATDEGLRLAKHIAKRFGEHGIGIASGLALGIDRAAHEGALRAGGKTVAVLANGLDDIYPCQHLNLAKDILQTDGAILSEYPEGSPPLPHQFLERNRIISGVSVATVVIEAPMQSGSLRTAREAAEQGRDVFVFPGSAGHPNYAGSHRLIREGARLVNSFEDIVTDLSALFEAQPALFEEPASPSDDTPEMRILHALKSAGGTASPDELCAKTGVDLSEMLAACMMLSIEGKIEEREGRFCIKNV